MVDYIIGSPVQLDSPVREQDGAVAQARNGAHVVAHEENSPPLRRHLAHLPQAPFLELAIPHRQHLVHQQDLGLQVSSHGESESH
ncbi:MAG: hypothetical protein ACYC3V_10530, partial [Chloroflexota bacterium]